MKTQHLCFWIALFMAALPCRMLHANNALPLSLSGNTTRAGAVLYELDARTYPTASETKPIFLRFSFDKGTRLAETKVWDHPNNPDNETRDPIYLALRVQDQQPGDSLTPNQGLSIVRWKAGESAIWVRVATNLADWLSENNFDPNQKLEVGFGTNPTNTFAYFADDFSNHLATLPGNSRNPNATDEADVVGTELLIDITQSTLIEPTEETNDSRQAIQNLNISLFNDRSSNLTTAETIAGATLGGVITPPSDGFLGSIFIGYVPTQLTAGGTP